MLATRQYMKPQVDAAHVAYLQAVADGKGAAVGTYFFPAHDDSVLDLDSVARPLRSAVLFVGL